MEFDWNTGALADGLRCYRDRQFWHAHEHWEAVWLQLDGQEKTFLQVLIQTTAAFHHLQRGNLVGTASLLRNALKRLEPLPDCFCGVAVEELRQEVRHWLSALERQMDVGHLPVPKIV